MKKVLYLLLLLPLGLHAQQEGYEIKVTFKPFRNQYIYLGHYFGKTLPIIDSVKLNEKSEGVFRGKTRLNGGIYLIGYPGRSNFFEFLVDKQQHFSILADTATLDRELKFVNSPDNELFIGHQSYVKQRMDQISALRAQLPGGDTTQLQAQMQQLNQEILKFRLDIMEKQPATLMATLLHCMREPEVPAHLQTPQTREDSTAAWQYFKSHFWDGVNFWDGRLAYTPFFETKLDKYIGQLTTPHPDSVIHELDWMLGYASVHPEMTRFLLIKFVNRYLNMKYMWEDKVFLHLFEKHFASKKYPWLDSKGEKIITERAYSLMANIMGNPAADIDLPDSTGKRQHLYQLDAAYTLVTFWDATCGHCKEVLPRMDSIYRAKWKAQGLRFFAVSKETNGTEKDWKDFISAQRLSEWVHVYYNKAEEKARVDAGIPGYSQLYDVKSFPTLYLLDREKWIIAKQLSWEQMDEVLQERIRAGN